MSEENEPTTVSPFSSKDVDEPRTVSPFMRIDRGEDTVDPETDALIFADFSPVVLPADAQEEVVEVAPKGGFVPGLAPSSVLSLNTEQSSSETVVPTPARTGDGTPKTNESLKPSSSSDQRSGQSEPPA